MSPVFMTGISSPSASSLIIVPDTGEDLSSSKASLRLILLLEAELDVIPVATLLGNVSGLLPADRGEWMGVAGEREEASTLGVLGDAAQLAAGENNFRLVFVTIPRPEPTGLIAMGATRGGKGDSSSPMSMMDAGGGCGLEAWKSFIWFCSIC